MIIKALKAFSDGVLSLHEGAIADVPDAIAEIYIRFGYAIEYTEGGDIDLSAYVKISDLPYVTPEQFGAKGDGVTDDTLAFSLAFASSKKVQCRPDKTYYFNGIVDASELSEGMLDINGATLLNFHIKIGIKGVYKTVLDGSAPAKPFIIKNGRLGEWRTKPTNWETPAIQSGTKLIIEDIYLGNTPYLVALTNSYLDGMIFKNIVLSMTNSALWTDETFELDAVNIIKEDGTFARLNDVDINRIPTVKQGFAGDCWNIEGVNEFRQMSNSDYAFCHFYRNTAIFINKCIQSKFVIGKYSQATFTSCHFEDASTNPELYNLTDINTKEYAMNNKVVTYRDCYFYNSYALETDNSSVEYYNCYIRATNASANRDTPLADNFKGVDYYDFKCKLHNCVIGNNITVDTDTMLSYKKLPKKTRSYRNGSQYEQTMADTIAKTRTLGTEEPTNVYPIVGTYDYKGYLFATGYKIAHEVYEWSREITSEIVDNDSNVNIQGLNGGWRFEIYRTLPSNGTSQNRTIQRARYYCDPNDRDSNSSVYFRLEDKGTYLNIVSGYGNDVNNEINIPIPWVNVQTIPNYDINNKVYEKNGVLVTTDNSKIEELPRNAQYAQVLDVFTV